MLGEECRAHAEVDFCEMHKPTTSPRLKQIREAQMEADHLKRNACQISSPNQMNERSCWSSVLEIEATANAGQERGRTILICHML